MEALSDDLQRRARRRAFIRAHHPDLGGDAAVFIAGLAAFDEPAAAGAARRVRVTVVRRRPLLVRLLRVLARQRRVSRVTRVR
ncbi:hypothetical protein ACQP2P_27205 [Dactylosporangium sp. CA-139114]|uniref:hypothetical protein n=1 Tax=Dactylosporangium sp. CA-139114 TaxID=3239931 RepID=UPI003D9765D6